MCIRDRENVERMQRMQEYHREQILEKIERDAEKARAIKYEQQEMMTKRMQMRSEIDSNKQHLMDKMEKVKSGKLDIGSIYQEFGKKMESNDSTYKSRPMGQSVQNQNFSQRREKNERSLQQEPRRKQPQLNPINHSAQKQQYQGPVSYSQFKQPLNKQLYELPLQNNSNLNQYKQQPQQPQQPQQAIVEQHPQQQKQQNVSEIKRMVEELKIQQNHEMLQILEEEQKYEDERTIRMERSIDNGEKKKLEKAFGIERAKAQKRITQLSQQHDKVIENVIKLSLIHISEPTRQAEISYAVFCLKKKKKKQLKMIIYGIINVQHPR
eukprot:TRINITY_DN8853_c0_g1_i1.p1 TRINITY_DN8853_c0_g1~~TRINITY_DN8853_c0_g1_i1.p1  ORF type:complete len:324 (-),score=55.19 TRINITY_DN8853_c0_g1_i1:20-991(-)